MKLKVLDLFSGIGGFSLGLERTGGFETIGFCEIDPYCQQVLKKHWPDVPIYDDVRSQDIERVRAEIVTAGFPCTQTSIAASIHGKRTGLEGKDSSLWLNALHHIGEIKPVWALVENPGGVKKWEDQVQGGLEVIGYRVSKLVFKASDFGLPHLRRRYVYVANANGKRLEVARPSKPSKVEWVKRLAAAGGSWLSSTPGVVGSFNGLPNRVDRIKALGNSVVPKIPEMIGRAILESTG